MEKNGTKNANCTQNADTILFVPKNCTQNAIYVRYKPSIKGTKHARTVQKRIVESFRV